MATTIERHDERQEGALIDVLHNKNEILHGTIVTAGADGFAHAGAPAEAVLGVAAETTPADKEYIRVWAEGVFTFNGAGFTQADTGKAVTVVDNDSVAVAIEGETNTLGKITNVISDTAVRVKIAL